MQQTSFWNFCIFSRKIRLHISCELSARQHKILADILNFPIIFQSKQDLAFHVNHDWHETSSLIFSKKYTHQKKHVISVAVISTIALSAKTKTDTCANSVDPDEMACNELSHMDLHCLPICFWFWTKTPIFINGPVQIKGRKRPHQKLRGERVKIKDRFSKDGAHMVHVRFFSQYDSDWQNVIMLYNKIKYIKKKWWKKKWNKKKHKQKNNEFLKIVEHSLNENLTSQVY